MLVASDPQRDHRCRHVRDRRLRPLRRLPLDARRRRAAGRERARDGLRRRRRSGRVRGPGRRRSSDARSTSGFPAYVAIALAGTIGYTIGSIGGWAIGLYGGRPYLERHGRWLHLNKEKLDRAERWFERWEDWAVFLGRLTPRHSLVRLDPGRRVRGAVRPLHAAHARSAPRSGASPSPAPAGRAGASWEDFHHAFRYVEYVVAAAVVVGVAWLGWRYVRSAGAGWPRSLRRLRNDEPRSYTRPRDQQIPLIDVKAQYAPLIPELKERVRRRARVRAGSSSGPRSRRSSDEAAALPRRAARDRSRERHGRARPRARGARDRARRRGRSARRSRSTRRPRRSPASARRRCSPTSTR